MAVQTVLTIISVLCGFLSAIALLFDWVDIITKFQLKRNVADRKVAYALIEKSERQFAKQMDGRQATGNFYLTGALNGIFVAQRVNATVYDRMHQGLRKTFDLEAYPLEEVEGILSREKVTHSFDQIREAIIYQRDSYERRDLKMVTFWLLAATLVTGLAAALV
ncbi:hypothetical protein QA644_27865 (plasmid) [Rhizobium sp. CC1099]|uniref:hypothetical protein n=1 Tax=Rhizobium sp. CC1099 TaxID=3039160 RepID=UPI0024B03D74|nr:hypothetical protein [Rhizobium sp. CC1099]WFU89866.1 hypothetical protein QA644_27865 [Rhizobium sp. CC1099]